MLLNIARSFARESRLRSSSLLRLGYCFSSSADASSYPRVFSWGEGTSGQLGNGCTTDPSGETGGLSGVAGTPGYTEKFPIEIMQLDSHDPDQSIVHIAAAGDGSGALTASGQLFLWGNNAKGTLGPIEEDRPNFVWPYLVDSGGVAFKSFSMSAQHCVAISTDGQVYTWGQNASSLGGPLAMFQGIFGPAKCKGLGHSDGASTMHPTLVEFPVSEDLKFTQVSCGDEHTLALTEDGEVWVWGSGEYGRLGNGWHSDALTPEPVEVLSALSGCKYIACGKAFSAAITDAGALYTWGRNDNGQLGCVGSAGLDVNNMEAIPVSVKIPPLKSISCGFGHSLAITDDGALYGWGMKRRMEPDIVALEEEGVKFVSTACGDRMCAAISDKGKVYSWGKGYITSGTSALRANLPKIVVSDKLQECDVMAIALGKNHLLASALPTRTDTNDDASAE